jgi:hypothetical protein
MHSTKEYNRFMDWFTLTYKSPDVEVKKKDSKLKLP